MCWISVSGPFVSVYLSQVFVLDPFLLLFATLTRHFHFLYPGTLPGLPSRLIFKKKKKIEHHFFSCCNVTSPPPLEYHWVFLHCHDPPPLCPSSKPTPQLTQPRRPGIRGAQSVGPSPRRHTSPTWPRHRSLKTPSCRYPEGNLGETVTCAGKGGSEGTEEATDEGGIGKRNGKKKKTGRI